MAEIIVVKEKLKQLTHQGVRYYFCLDGERVGNHYFLANADQQEYTVEAAEGKHTVTLIELGVAVGSVPKEIVSYEFEAAQPKTTVYLRYNNKEKNVYFSETAEEEVKSGGGLFGKLFKK